MQPIERLRPPPIPEQDASSFVWKKWFESVYLQIYNEVNPNDVVDTDTTLSLGFLIPVNCTGGAVTIRLPASNRAKAKKYIIKKIDSSANAVTVDADGSDLIDGAATQTLSAQWDAIFIESDGLGNWYVLGAGSGSGGGSFTPDTISAIAVEALAAGQFVAVYDASGTPKCRIAKSSSGQGYQADGFVKNAYAAGAVATIWLPGSVNHSGGTGLTAGDVWLGTNGYATNTPPTTAGYICQQIGVAESSTSVAFEPQPDILRNAAASLIVGSTLQSQIFTANGTFTPPTGVTAVWVDIYGAGGGGGGGTTGVAGGGGGAGEYCQGLLVPVSGPTAVTIGTGGAGGIGLAGGTGNSSSFGNWTALGGEGGGVGTTSFAGNGGGVRGADGNSGVGQIGEDESPSFYGGSSGGGSNFYGGGSGGNLVGGPPGADPTRSGGGGGSSPVGVGAAGGTFDTVGSAGTANTGVGGGGGGKAATTTTTGGAGGSGLVIVYWVGAPIL